MARNNNKATKGAANALDALKYEVAAELGIPLDKVDNGELTTRQVGKIGGSMTRKLVEFAEDYLKNQGPEAIIHSGQGMQSVQEIDQRNQSAVIHGNQ